LNQEPEETQDRELEKKNQQEIDQEIGRILQETTKERKKVLC
jgi:hypothetical protein